MTVIGLDLSLTATGWCVATAGMSFETGTLGTKLTGLERLDYLRRVVLEKAEKADLVVMEGLSFGSNDPSAQERAGLAFLVRLGLWKRQQRFTLVAPSSLKKFVTGKGNAEKSLVLKEVYKRWGVDAANDNEADSIGLAVIGLAMLGATETANDAQREVLKKITSAA